MKILYKYHNIPEDLKGAVLAIGNFDGVHRGHRFVLTVAQDIARASDAKNGVLAKSGVIAFDPHPKALFDPARLMFELSSINRKLKLFETFGMDLAVILKFDDALAELSAADFVKKVLVQGLNVRHVVAGYNFHFGKDRQGSPEDLQKFGIVHHFGVTIVPQQKGGETLYSSTSIRNLLKSGQVREAAALLGYWWRIEGHVIGGAKRGTGLGFPTANIELKNGQDLKHGIYAVHVYKDGERYQAAAYLGKRPTFDNGVPYLEVFLFDFDDNLYGQSLEVEFIDYIRGDKTFDDEESLKQQMALDCEKARELLRDAEQRVPTILSL